MIKILNKARYIILCVIQIPTVFMAYHAAIYSDWGEGCFYMIIAVYFNLLTIKLKWHTQNHK